MSMPSGPQKEHPSTYFMQNRNSQDEMKRLQAQGHTVTARMGGVLPEQPDSASFRRVLDVGCGTGHWIIETAKTYPSITSLVGVDISRKMVEYACSQAKAEQVSERVEFRVMDALRMLEFPTGSFDLVNQRSAVGWLRTWDWPKLLEEYWRVARRGGVVRITEGHWLMETSSPALSRLSECCAKAFYYAGHSFVLGYDGVTSELPRLLTERGLENVQTRTFIFEYCTGTPEWQDFYKHTEIFYRTVQPFLRKWMRLPDDYEDLYQQALNEMQQPDFVAKLHAMTVWGNTSLRR